MAARPPARAAGKGLTKKVGPLPLWAWGVIIVGGVLVGIYIRNRMSGGNSTIPAGTTSTSMPDTTGQTGGLGSSGSSGDTSGAIQPNQPFVPFVGGGPAAPAAPSAAGGGQAAPLVLFIQPPAGPASVAPGAPHPVAAAKVGTSGAAAGSPFSPQSLTKTAAPVAFAPAPGAGGAPIGGELVTQTFKPAPGQGGGGPISGTLETVPVAYSNVKVVSPKGSPAPPNSSGSSGAHAVKSGAASTNKQAKAKAA